MTLPLSERHHSPAVGFGQWRYASGRNCDIERGMDGFFGFVVFAVVAALTYETPLFLAGLFGERTALVGWWNTVSASGDTARIIIFIAAYIVAGFTLWAAPLWYLITVLRPEGGAVARQRTGAVLSMLFFPLVPLWDRLAGHINEKIDARRDLKELRAQYRSDFRDAYPTFEEFLAAVRRKAAEPDSGPEQAPPPPPPKPSKAELLKDAEGLLGLELGYTAQDLRAQYLMLIRQFHPGPHTARSDLAQRINNARDTIIEIKGWKK